ncbi:ribulose bisphosphate carboxylase small subunit [Polymorphobacter sp.]|uniref:ribulose bisphosphate carboxylase small subunit n=1 Tax=Polymorphobacter sp. TaxID=1909290 RepID=UPI003F72801D
MRITQGTFSFLPDLDDTQIAAQVQYCLDKGWAVNLEYTDDPHPRNTYWEMWGAPMFDVPDAAGVMLQLAACRKANAGAHYIRLSAFDNAHGWESIRLSFITDRPANEAGFALVRQEMEGRRTVYTTRAYGTDRPDGERYGG